MIGRNWLRGLPKAELHVHLEGTVTPEAYARIARRNGMDVSGDAAAVFACQDFESFLNAIVRVVRALQTPRDFEEIAAAYLQRSLSEGVRHVEFMFSPATIRYFTPEADLGAIVNGIGRACEAARSTGISSLIIFDMVRNLGEAAAFADLELAIACQRYGVVGVGLGGDERRFPAREFKSAFDRAAQLGLRRTVHAGEAEGSFSVIEAIEQLGAERIGHGVAAAKDPSALDVIRTNRIAIDACLTSNRITGAWDGNGKHALTAFVDAGIPTTLNSDDPAFFHASLLDEYELASTQGLTREQIVQLARASFEYSFASEKEKRIQLEQLDAYVHSAGAVP